MLRTGARRALLYRPVVVVASSTTALDSGKKSANVTLSNGDLTATHTVSGTAYDSVLSVVGKTSGKYYWEVHVDSAQSLANLVGVIANTSQSLTTSGGGANSVVWDSSDGNVYANGVSIGVANSYASTGGQYLKFAVDLDNERIWLKVDSGNWNNDAGANPATNTGGFDFSAINAGPYYAYVVLRFDNCVSTINFGATSFNSAAPSNFGNLG